MTARVARTMSRESCFEVYDRVVELCDRQRDRCLSYWDIVVLRFTGSEIHNDAPACSEEVWATISKRCGWKP